MEHDDSAAFVIVSVLVMFLFYLIVVICGDYISKLFLHYGKNEICSMFSYPSCFRGAINLIMAFKRLFLHPVAYVEPQMRNFLS